MDSCFRSTASLDKARESRPSSSVMDFKAPLCTSTARPKASSLKFSEPLLPALALTTMANTIFFDIVSCSIVIIRLQHEHCCRPLIIQLPFISITPDRERGFMSQGSTSASLSTRFADHHRLHSQWQSCHTVLSCYDGSYGHRDYANLCLHFHQRHHHQ